MSALWTAQEVASATNGKTTGAWEATGISINSRDIKPGQFFVALKGPQFNAHDFVKSAVEQGAPGVMVDHLVEGIAPEKQVVVADTYKALEMLGIASRARMHGKVIAVTGSVGKTGHKEALRQVLEVQAPTYANVGSFNNHWGVPTSLARMARDSRYGVFEIGMNHTGELGPLSRQVRPHIALITNIAPVHIGNFRDLDEIAAAKAEIFEGLEPGGHAVLNADNSYFEFLKARTKANVVSFGKAGKDAKLEGFTLSADGSEVKASILGRTYIYKVGQPGEHWVMNSLAVLLTAGIAGADVAKAAETLGQLKLATGRGGVHEGAFTIIDESYNASPISMEMAIKVLAGKKPGPGGRRLLAIADMKELGHQARDFHVGLAPAIQAAQIDQVFCCGEIMKHLFDALPAKLQGGYAPTSDLLAPIISAAIRPGDIITIKGSHSMAMEKVVAALAQQNTNQPVKKTSAG